MIRKGATYNIGRLNKRLELWGWKDAPAQGGDGMGGSDGMGGAAGEYEKKKTAWADVTPLSAKEVLYYEKQNTIVSHIITLRAEHKVTGQMIGKIGSREFHFRGVIDKDEVGAYLQIIANEETK